MMMGSAFSQETLMDEHARQSLEKRVEDLFDRLTQEEKFRLLNGTGFTTQLISRLGIPALAMADAGQGVRGGLKSMEGPATAFPSGVAMGSTWDPDLIRRVAQAIGVEARNKGSGAQVLLGPAVNIHRSPLGGRNGEYFSEDPHLTARLGVAYIQGMQSTGVAACIKHFACNNHEHERFKMNVRVSERALREIYWPAFEAGVKEGGAWMVMSSYNKLNGVYASANAYLLTDVLKTGWGFDGMVTSDWGGVHETGAVQAGNDLEMPDGKHTTAEKVNKALQDGSVTQAAVDDAVRRIVRTMLRTGLFEPPTKPDPAKVNSMEHRQLALEAAVKGIVLLKNEKELLPLDLKKIKSIAVIGEAARHLQVGALGSPAVRPLRTVQLFEGIRDQAGADVTVRYEAARTDGVFSRVSTPDGAAGLRAEYFNNKELKGEPALVRNETEIGFDSSQEPAPGIPNTDFSVRWTGRLAVSESGPYLFTFTGDDGFRVFVDGQLLIDHWALGAARAASGTLSLEAGKTYELKLEYFQAGGEYLARFGWRMPAKPLYAQAVQAAREADVAVVCVSTRRTEGEGSDRPSFALPDAQADLIRAVAEANPRTVVVMNNGSPVAMKEWLDKVPAVLEAWLPGQEGGAALAAILFGEANPSGRLPDTLAADREDYPDAPGFPGKDLEIEYQEGIYVGYRHFDKKGIAPLFPFGHGLSYTAYRYENLQMSAPELSPDETVEAVVEVTNTGKRAGEEVVQLYVRDSAPKIDKPVRELKGFARVKLAPGETHHVTLTLRPRDFAYFDTANRQWRADAGTYEIEIGASSQDIRQQASVRLRAAFTEAVPLSRENFK
jgi:beta-glucosidase